MPIVSPARASTKLSIIGRLCPEPPFEGEGNPMMLFESLIFNLLRTGPVSWFSRTGVRELLAQMPAG